MQGVDLQKIKQNKAAEKAQVPMRNPFDNDQKVEELDAIIKSDRRKISSIAAEGEIKPRNMKPQAVVQPPAPKFVGNIHVDKHIPQNYKMQMKPLELEEEQLGVTQEGFESFNANKTMKKEERMRLSSSGDAMPSNEEVQDALDVRRSTLMHANVSVMEDFDADPEIPSNAAKQSKRMESFKSSILSKSSSSQSDYDRMSEQIAEFIQVKEEHGVQSEDYIKGKARGHKKNVQTMNRILPAPDEMEQFLAVRKSPEEEFFLMTLVCYELNHAHMKKICDINSQKLFNRAAVELKLPFYQFPGFIEKELDSAYMNLMYKQRKKKHMKKAKPLTKLQKRQRARVKECPEELYGKVLDDDYDFDDEYF